MGTSYTYKCNKCGFEHDYFIGGGFFIKEYYEETEKLENKLKEEAISGKYGTIIKAMLDADTEGKIRFNCETELFQCRRCKNLLVHRQKHIGLWLHSDNQYELDIDIIQTCPGCGSDVLKKARKYKPTCPKCKENALELISLGKWD